MLTLSSNIKQYLNRISICFVREKRKKNILDITSMSYNRILYAIVFWSNIIGRSLQKIKKNDQNDTF